MSNIDLFGCQGGCGSCGTPCVYRQMSMVINNFTGTEVALGSLPVSASDIRVYWNGMRLAEFADYTYTNQLLTFTEPKDDCRIIIDYLLCVAIA